MSNSKIVDSSSGAAAGVPLTNAEVWEMVSLSREQMKPLYHSQLASQKAQRGLRPDAECLKEEVRVLQYLQREGQLMGANGKCTASPAAIASDTVSKLQALPMIRLSAPEQMQLVNLHAQGECDVYTVVGDLEGRCADPSVAVTAILECLPPAPKADG